MVNSILLNHHKPLKVSESYQQLQREELPGKKLDFLFESMKKNLLKCL